MAKTWGLILPVMLALTGCTAVGEKVVESQVEAAATEASAEKSKLQELADRLLVEVEGREHRNLRMCMIVAGVTELMTYRVTKFDPDYAEKALGQMTALVGIRARFEASSGIFLETDMRLALLQLSSVMIEVAKDRVTGLLGMFGGGVNVTGVTERARVVAAQGALIEALIRDTRNLFNVTLANGDLLPEQALALCEERIDMNYGRVLGMLGVPTESVAP